MNAAGPVRVCGAADRAAAQQCTAARVSGGGARACAGAETNVPVARTRLRYSDPMVKAVLALALSGCSFVTMRSPHGTPPACEQSRVVPLADVLVAVASPFLVYSSVRGGVNNIGESSESRMTQERALGAVLISFPVWGVFGASAIYGFAKADRCSRAKQEYQQQMAAAPGAGQYAARAGAPTGAAPLVAPAQPSTSR